MNQSVEVIKQLQRGGDSPGAKDERTYVALARHSDRSIHCEKVAVLRRPHARRNHDPRKVVICNNQDSM